MIILSDISSSSRKGYCVLNLLNTIGNVIATNMSIGMLPLLNIIHN